MAEFFTSVLDFFKTLFGVVGDIYKAWIDFFAFIPRLFVMTNQVSSALPLFIVPFLALGITILVIRVIIDLL